MNDSWARIMAEAEAEAEAEKKKKNYIIYYVALKDIKTAQGKNIPLKEKMAKIKAETPEEAIELFYKEYSSKKYEATGFDQLIVPCNW